MEPGEQLDELQLVIEVVLEPKHHLLMAARGAQRGVALRELSLDGILVSPPRLRDEPGPEHRKLLERQ